MLATPVIAPPSHAENVGIAPAAQDVMERGIAAARQQDYRLAYRYFLDAQKADPQASQIWFNLGLAASRIPGYEFRAIAWFKAYLLANPETANAAAVRSQLAQLEVSLESRLGKVVAAIEPIAKLVVDHEPVVNVWSSKPIADTPENRKKLRTPSYVEIGGLLTAMHLYLGDKDAAETTRRRFFIEKGKVPYGFTIVIPAHLERGLASAGLYDELFFVENKMGWPSYDGAAPNAPAADRVLFATERGDIDVARKMPTGAPDLNYAACKYYELGRLDDAKSVGDVFGKDDSASTADKLFAEKCSGWWLKRGDITSLIAHGRDGQPLVVNGTSNSVKTGQFNDTTSADFFSALQKHIALSQKFGGASAYNIKDALESLADFLEAYRQMRGPYDRP